MKESPPGDLCLPVTGLHGYSCGRCSALQPLYQRDIRCGFFRNQLILSLLIEKKFEDNVNMSICNVNVM